MVSWKDAVAPSDSQGTAGELDPTGAICGSDDEGVGTRICVDPWLLQLGEEKKIWRCKSTLSNDPVS